MGAATYGSYYNTMSTSKHDKPFMPDHTVDRDRLMAYLEGRADPAEQWDVERAMENDPLLHDAVEGLSQTGALQAMGALDNARPSPGSNGRWVRMTLALSLMIVGAAAWLVVSSIMEEDVVTDLGLAQEHPATTIQEMQPLPQWEELEIEAATEQPESLLIGHQVDDRHAEAMVSMPMERGVTVEPMAPSGVEPRSLSSETTAGPEHLRRSFQQVIYLHDLKVLHPDAMHPITSQIVQAERHVPARHEDMDLRDQEEDPMRTMAYLPFMDAALAKFAQLDHKGSLTDLLFLLEQYPTDANALFYAGLCSYNLGMYERAQQYLHRASLHPTGVFDQEAEWYHALALERSGDREAAHSAMQHIVEEDGFYATRAREHLLGQ